MPASESAADDRAATSTSRSLLARLHANEPAAWDRLITLYAPLIWHWCRKMALPQQDVADVFQEVFKAVALHIATFRKDRPKDTFRGWLRTITKNKVHDHFRARERQPSAAGGTEAKVWLSQIPDIEEDEAAESAVESHLFQRALALIQSEFAESTWRAFWGVVVDGRSPQEVGAGLGMTAGAVRVAKCRVLHRLRQELGDVAI
jgi:RNA polymerase sigma-70 factor (ECF subfamily)